MAKKRKGGKPRAGAALRSGRAPSALDDREERASQPEEEDDDDKRDADSDDDEAPKPKKKAKTPDDDTDDAPKPMSPGVRGVVIVAAALFLVTVWLDGVGSNWPQKLMPRPWVYFAQVAALFPHAAEVAIDYRAEGWSCADKKWVEVDVRPYFLIERDTKENRFERVLYFYRKDRKVMRELEEYVVKRHNAASAPRIGGTRFLSLRIPFPPPGAKAVKWEHKPLASYPKEQRHDWYWTPKAKRIERCGTPKDAKDSAPDEEPAFHPKAEKEEGP